MDISTTQYHRTDVIKVAGRVDANTTPQLQETLEGLMDSGRYNLAIDMADVDFLSSKGLWLLTETLKNCQKHNRGNLVLVYTSERIKESLGYLGLENMFQFYDDMTEAVGSF